MFNTVNSGHALSVFQGKRKLLKNPECKKYIQYSEKFQAGWFSGEAQSYPKILKSENIFNTVYVHLWVIRVVWASVVCNLDQSRDWL